MSLFWKLVYETQMPKPPEATRHHKLIKLLILLPLRADLLCILQYAPCTHTHTVSWIVTYIVHTFYQNSYKKTTFINNKLFIPYFSNIFILFEGLFSKHYYAEICPVKLFHINRPYSYVKPFVPSNFILCLGELEQLFFSLYKRQYVLLHDHTGYVRNKCLNNYNYLL